MWQWKKNKLKRTGKGLSRNGQESGQRQTEREVAE